MMMNNYDYTKIIKSRADRFLRTEPVAGRNKLAYVKNASKASFSVV